MNTIRAMVATATMTGGVMLFAVAPAAADTTLPRCETYPVDGKPTSISAPTDADKMVVITETGSTSFFDVTVGQHLEGSGDGILAITKCFLDPATPEVSPDIDDKEPAPTPEPEEPAPETEASDEPAPEAAQPTPEAEPEATEETDPDASAPEPVDPDVDDGAEEVVDDGDEEEVTVDDEPTVLGPEPLIEDPTEPDAPRTEAAPASPRVRQDTLAYTGSETPLLAGAGAGLVIVGTTMMWASRRRTTGAPD